MSESLGEVLRRAQADGCSLEVELATSHGTFSAPSTFQFGPRNWGCDYRTGDVWGLEGKRQVAVPAHAVLYYRLSYPERSPP